MKGFLLTAFLFALLALEVHSDTDYMTLTPEEEQGHFNRAYRNIVQNELSRKYGQWVKLDKLQEALQWGNPAYGYTYRFWIYVSRCEYRRHSKLDSKCAKEFYGTTRIEVYFKHNKLQYTKNMDPIWGP